MAFKAVCVIWILLAASINAQTTHNPLDVDSTETFDTSSGGKPGNPGGQVRFSTKALDEVYKHAVEMIARSLRSMVIPDVIVPIGSGMLSIKNTRVVEAKIVKYERQLMPPNRIRSRLTDGQLTSVGEWQFKPLGATRSIGQGLFRTVVVQAEINMTNQLTRSWDAKPMVQTHECKANLQRFRVEIEGFGDNTTVIEECSNLLCQRIRAYFEDSVCNTARNYVKDTINQFLSTFPTRIHLGPAGSKFTLNFDLLHAEPKVTSQYIQAHLEGEVMSRGVSSPQFGANDLSILDDERHMMSFPLSDYSFNTLFHQAHAQQFRFSATDLLPKSSTIKHLLKLDCPSMPDQYPAQSASRRTYKDGRWGISTGLDIHGRSGCLGLVFENSTSGQYPKDSFGDLVFKSQRPLAVFVRQEQKSYFGTNAGFVEVYGPLGNDGKRELLGKANVDLLRADFVPAMSGCNITGTISITHLHLSQVTPSPQQQRNRQMNDLALSKLTNLASPLFTEMFNAFFDQYAKFPLPLIDGYECASPEFRWSDRTMQIDCDIRVMSDAIRKKN